MSVAPNGRIDAIWNDTRDDPSNQLSRVYYSYSTDEGVTWTPNQAMTPQFDSMVGFPNQNKIGDYYDMESDLTGASLAYSATFNGEQDVYFMRITVDDCNTNGISDVDDIANMTRDELRAAVREARADVAAKDERIGKLSEQVNRAEEKASKAQRRWKSSTPDDQQLMLEQRVVAAKLEITAAVGTEKYGLAAALVELADHCNANGLDCAAFVGGTLDELIGAVRHLRDGYDYGFPVALAQDAVYAKAAGI